MKPLVSLGTIPLWGRVCERCGIFSQDLVNRFEFAECRVFKVGQCAVFVCFKGIVFSGFKLGRHLILTLTRFSRQLQAPVVWWHGYIVTFFGESIRIVLRFENFAEQENTRRWAHVSVPSYFSTRLRRTSSERARPINWLQSWTATANHQKPLAFISSPADFSVASSRMPLFMRSSIIAFRYNQESVEWGFVNPVLRSDFSTQPALVTTARNLTVCLSSLNLTITRLIRSILIPS